MLVSARGALLALLVLGAVEQHVVSAGFFDTVRGGLTKATDAVVKPVKDLLTGHGSSEKNNGGAFTKLGNVAGSLGGGSGAAAKVAPPTTSGGSSELLQKFKSQSQSLPQVDIGSSAQQLLKPLTKVASSAAQIISSLLNLSLLIRGKLTAPKAGYSEPYTVWYDPGSGASRVDFHGGNTSSFIVPQKDGLVQSVLVQEERWGEKPMRRCVMGPIHAATPLDGALSILPDLSLFNFAGLTEGGAQRWLHTVAGKVGELGAAPGEALSFKHELLFVDSVVAGIPLPTKYSVSVDSSVLGAASDGFAHEYSSVLVQPHDKALFDPRLSACDVTDTAKDSPQQLAALNPLREFTMEHRDTKYDSMLEQFKVGNALQYIDNIEEAIRKNLFVQASRFVDSINRRGLPFLLELNFLADRLEEELAVLRGGSEDDGAGGDNGSAPSVAKRSTPEELPKEFDWRDLGAVSPVEYQGNCASCWAFAVAGAVEGATFVRTGRLVPLSLQALVDCGKQYGANGCRGTWPEKAYAYVSARGLPAAADYPPYSAAVETCRVKDEGGAGAATRIAGYKPVPSGNPAQLQSVIRTHGPAVVIIDAKPKTFLYYKSGVLEDDSCGTSKKELNHAVLAVGWGVKDGELHFILKNSWSDKWGDSGYIRVAAGSNTCGVLSQSTYPMVES